MVLSGNSEKVFETIKGNTADVKDLDAFKYARGVEEGFLYGTLNISPKEMEMTGTYVNMLNPMQRNMAYKQGIIAGQKKTRQTRQQQENIDSVYEQARSALGQKGTDAGNHGVHLADGLTEENMGKTQHTSYEFAKQIAPAVKANIRIYNGGKEWGYYDPKTDTICLNINAKWSGVSMMTFTLAHELVHRAALGSPVKYKAFADFLIQQYGKQGASVNAMVQEQLKAAEENGISMTYEEAFEEVICDACQKLLVDTDAGKNLAEFSAKSKQNKNIVKQFGQWLKELMQKLRRIFRNVEPDFLAAQEFQKFDDNIKQNLADMFVDMSMDAGEKLSTIKAAGLTEKITTGEGGAKYKRLGDRALEDKYYKRLIDNWDGLDHGGSFRVGKPSKALLDVGIPDVDIWFDQSKARKQLEGKSEIDKNVLKKIPDILGNPIAITESYDNTVVVFGKVFDEFGHPIVVALRVNSTNRRNHITLVNKVRSVGTRNNNLDTLLAESAILYLNANKKETNRWFNALGRSTPFGGTKFGLIRSITFDLPSVNKNSETPENGGVKKKLPVAEKPYSYSWFTKKA